jgi:hypothetical protein
VATRVVDLCCRSDGVRFAPREWTKRLLEVLANVGNIQRLALPDSGRSPAAHVAFEDRFFTIFCPSFLDHDTAKHLFADGIDILEDYHLARSSVEERLTRATNAGVKEDDIDWLCRWNTGGEETGGAPLRVLYSDRTQLLETYLRFSLAL